MTLGSSFFFLFIFLSLGQQVVVKRLLNLDQTGHFGTKPFRPQNELLPMWIPLYIAMYPNFVLNFADVDTSLYKRVSTFILP